MKNFIIFISGAAIGSVITWKIVEKYYKDLADEEINSVINTFKELNKESNDKSQKEEIDGIKDSEYISEYHGVSSIYKNPPSKQVKEDKKNTKNTKTKKNKLIKEEIKEDDTFTDDPRIIDVNEFGYDEKTDQNYAVDSWIVYSDGVITNGDEPIENYKTYLGKCLNIDLFLEDTSEDSLYIRNEALKTDYEILKSEKNFIEPIPGE